MQRLTAHISGTIVFTAIIPVYFGILFFSSLTLFHFNKDKEGGDFHSVMLYIPGSWLCVCRPRVPKKEYKTLHDAQAEAQILTDSYLFAFSIKCRHCHLRLLDYRRKKTSMGLKKKHNFAADKKRNKHGYTEPGLIRRHKEE